MNINRKLAVAFLLALGFEKAGDWDNDKLSKRMSQVPTQVDAADVPAEHKDFYKKLVDAKGSVTVDEGDKPEKSEKPPKEGKSSKKSTEEEGKSSKKSTEEEAAPKEKKKAGSKAKTKSPPKDDVKRDAFGCKVGTISAEVNAVMSDDWKTEAEIAKEAGVSLDQARGRLYYAAEKGEFEREKSIRYRLKPAKKGKKPSKE